MGGRHILFLVACFLAAVNSKSLRQNEEDVAVVEEYISLKRAEINPRFRLHYHIAPPVGWMNDPNGFSFYNGEYHLFYQFYPYDSVWGPMHWGHVVSSNLVNWRQLPTALVPEEEQCFSGSAIQVNHTLVVMYTAHKVTQKEPFSNETQYLAFSIDGETFHKYEGNPVIATAPNGSPDFRDPKVWKHEDYYYVILGSKTLDERGRVLLYRSKDMLKWDFLSVLGESKGELGYMWECPDFFELDGKFVLLMSPQGVMPQEDRFKNTYQTGYIIGDFNYKTFEFVPQGEFQEIDYGHDFYATQTTEVNGRRLVIAWFGMWDVPHPEDVDGWAGAMTIVRELKLHGNTILMQPVEEMLLLRSEVTIDGYFNPQKEIKFDKTAEILIEGDLAQPIKVLLEGEEGGNKVWLHWDPEVGKVVVDRDGDIRQVEWSPIGSHSWRIFLDASSLELFCGEGEVVFSSRVYPIGAWKVTNLSSQVLTIEAYTLNRSVPE